MGSNSHVLITFHFFRTHLATHLGEGWLHFSMRMIAFLGGLAMLALQTERCWAEDGCLYDFSISGDWLRLQDLVNPCFSGTLVVAVYNSWAWLLRPKQADHINWYRNFCTCTWLHCTCHCLQVEMAERGPCRGILARAANPAWY